jgi:lipopolysaccharide biosynthesis glycosyltransferase
MDKFRWSMKSVFIKHLLEIENYNKVIYVDNDIHFFNDYNFLFDELDNNDILLTPHWSSSNPYLDEKHYSVLYTSGLFNAGFIGVNNNAVKALNWWAFACEYICEKNESKGQYVDQTHLNLFPIYFDNVKILKHRGCNVAKWNQIECKRTLIANGELYINKKYPIVFIHFTKCTIGETINGNDTLLMPYLIGFNDLLKKNGLPVDFVEKYKIKKRTYTNQNIVSGIYYYLKFLINKVKRIFIYE